MKKVPQEELAERLLAEAEKSILAVGLEGGKRYLDPNYGVESLADWARQKFGLNLNPADAADKDPAQLDRPASD